MEAGELDCSHQRRDVPRRSGLGRDQQQLPRLPFGRPCVEPAFAIQGGLARCRQQDDHGLQGSCQPRRCQSDRRLSGSHQRHFIGPVTQTLSDSILAPLNFNESKWARYEEPWNQYWNVGNGPLLVSPGPNHQHNGSRSRRSPTILQAAKESAQQRNAPSAIAVVDPAGDLLAFQRMDNVRPASADLAIEKARTAARLQRSTTEIEDNINQG